MTEIVATTAGYFPRPNYLIRTLKNVEGYQKEGIDPDIEKKVEDEFKRGRRDVIEIQEEADLDMVTEGQLAWDDILAFPATRIDGIEMNGIIRFYDNNRYYRRPMIEEELGYTSEITVEENQSAQNISNTNVKAVMAGPYSLTDLSTDNHYGDHEQVLNSYSDVVNQELRRLDEAGITAIQLDEPSLTKPEANNTAVNAIKRAIRDIEAEVIVHTYFGDISHVYPSLLDTNIDGVGFDLVSGASGNKDALKEHGITDSICIGCMNARNTRLESNEEIQTTVNEVLSQGEPDRVYISPNCGLDFLPWSVMEDKVKRLGEAAAGVTA